MTIINAIKKIEKIGKVENQGQFYFVRLDNKKIAFIKNGSSDSAIVFHVDYYNENHEKYHTAYFDNCGQMLKYINNN